MYKIDRKSENLYSNIIWREEQIKHIIKQYQVNLISIKKIAKEFQVHENSIKKVLQKNDIHIRNQRESRCLDGRKIDIFHNIDTEEKAYWLGFLAADGCVYKNYISCGLQHQDREHLEKLRRFIGTSVSIKTPGKMKYPVFTLGCVEIAQDLKKHGVIEKKSLALQPPHISPEFYFDWIRGFYDGDGGVSLSPNMKRYQMYFTSTKAVLEWIKEKIEVQSKIRLENKCINTYRLPINGRLQVKRILDLLYHNNTATIYLDRKYDIYKKILLHAQNAVNP